MAGWKNHLEIACKVLIGIAMGACGSAPSVPSRESRQMAPLSALASAPTSTLGGRAPSPTLRAPEVVAMEAGFEPPPPPMETVVEEPAGGVSERLVWGDTEWLGRIAPPDDPSLLIRGVDLGVPFVSKGRLHFLFGDTWSDGPLADRDPVATLAPDGGPDDVRLAFHRSDDGPFAPIGFDRAIGTGTFEVPVDGLDIGADTYVFYASDFDGEAGRHGTSVLAHTSGPLDFSELEVDHAVSSRRFLTISAVEDGGTVWLFASGAYRQSAVYLARADAATLADRASWQYVSGVEDGEPQLAARELDAAPLFESSCVGELSVRRDPTRELYLMTYNCDGIGEPRGVHLRVARAPWGPWSEPVVVFAPDRDGYGKFIHRATCGHTQTEGCVIEDDGLSDPGREGEWGGEYGPYLIEPWLESDDGLLTLYYTLSSWNPYATHLVRTTLLRDGAGTE